MANVVAVFNENVAEYDRWFDENPQVYEAELEAVRRYLPRQGRGLEIGVGTGRFAAPLGVAVGVDPAPNMVAAARARGIRTYQAYGEALPFAHASFDYVLMVTVDPFVRDLARVLSEARRVLTVGGHLVVGMIDRESDLGRAYEANKGADKFYRHATFHSVQEMVEHLQQAGFSVVGACQTILGRLQGALETGHVEVAFLPNAFAVHEGYGQGAFVVIDARKLST